MSMPFVLRVRYRKEGRLRFLGHLEVLRTQDRCIRRSGLPFAVTQGFSPHMRIAFSPALPVGAASRCEWFDLSLDGYVPADHALAALVRATPPDLAPDKAAYVDPHAPALGAWLDRASWEVSLASKAMSAVRVRERMGSLVDSGAIDFVRSGKPRHVDLATTLVSWDVVSPGETCDDISLLLSTRSSNDGALRPDVLVNALERVGGEGPRTFSRRSVRRLGQWHEGETGLVEPL